MLKPFQYAFGLVVETPILRRPSPRRVSSQPCEELSAACPATRREAAITPAPSANGRARARGTALDLLGEYKTNRVMWRTPRKRAKRLETASTEAW